MRRVLLTAAVWVVVGVVVSLAIAWTTSNSNGGRGPDVRPFTRVVDEPARVDRGASRFRTTWWYLIRTSADEPADLSVAEAGLREHLPRWTRSRLRIYGPFENAPEAYTIGSFTANGFPLRCVYKYSSGWHTSVAVEAGRSGIEHHTDSFRVTAFGRPLFFGTALIPLNLLINAIIWGGAAAMLVHGPVRARRLYRAKRNRCTRCGYDLGGSASGSTAGCTECGHGYDSRDEHDRPGDTLETSTR